MIMSIGIVLFIIYIILFFIAKDMENVIREAKETHHDGLRMLWKAEEAQRELEKKSSHD